MSRCYSCNRKLSDYECSLKNDETKEYMDMCTKCLQGLSIAVTGNSSLLVGNEVDVDDINDTLPDEEWVFEVPDNKNFEDE